MSTRAKKKLSLSFEKTFFLKIFLINFQKMQQNSSKNPVTLYATLWT